MLERKIHQAGITFRGLLLILLIHSQSCDGRSDPAVTEGELIFVATLRRSLTISTRNFGISCFEINYHW